jgi:hypothetical protein
MIHGLNSNAGRCRVRNARSEKREANAKSEIRNAGCKIRNAERQERFPSTNEVINDFLDECARDSLSRVDHAKHHSD